MTTEDVQRIKPSEAKALLDDDEAVLYDVRSTEAYETKHAVGAISLPEPKVSGRLDELPDDKTLIFY
jgi:rhodanese-related sulfurtransferase